MHPAQQHPAPHPAPRSAPTQPAPEPAAEGDAGAASTAVESSRRQKTRARLMDAAYQVFSERGVPGTSVEAICECAGFTRGAFYSNFSSKEELFFALMERENEARVRQLQADIAAHLPEPPESPESPESSGSSGSSGSPESPGSPEQPESPQPPEQPEPGAERGEVPLAAIVQHFFRIQRVDRRWCLVEEEFGLLALRDPAVAHTFRRFQRRFFEQLALVAQTALAEQGMRFTHDAVESLRLLGAVFQQANRDALLEGETGDPLAQGGLLELAPTVLLGLIEPR